MADLPPSSVDGVTVEPQASRAPVAASPKRTIIIAVIALYAVLILWSLLLVVLLPSPTGDLGGLVLVGVASFVVTALVFLGAGWLGIQRIAKASDIPEQVRRFSMIKLAGVVVPGLLICLIVPFVIMREPPLVVDIVSPERSEDFVAPLSVKFDANRGAAVLHKLLGEQPIKYTWDYESDGKPNEQTAVPTAAAVYDRPGYYTVTVIAQMPSGAQRRLMRRFLIPRAVFSMSPIVPIVEQPVRFGVGGLVSDPKQIKEVQWDFDGDGRIDETTTELDIVHTFYSTGKFAVSAALLLENKSQISFSRNVDVIEPPPLPFPVTLVTVPKSLIGPAPFSLLAHIETPEQVSEVNWSFGDEEGESGKDLVKIGHSYERPGIYPLTAKVRIQSGSAAILSTIVRVTDALQIHDLSFESPEGLPKVEAGNVIKGEAPLTLQIRPRTALPLIEFSWEAPEESNPSFEGGELKAVFRDTGNYTVVLFAKNAEGRSMRLPITVEVAPPPIEPSVEIRKDSETAPMTVTFDASDSYIPPGERIAGFKWLFGDEKDRNELPELGRPRVTHVYENPGTYQLTLSVVLESGREYSVVRTIVVPKPDLRACFVRSRATITTGSPVRFDGSCSAGKVTTALWEIRSVSSPEKVLAQSPTFPMYTATFDAPGRYTVKLLVRDQWEAEDQESVTLDVESPLPETP